MICITRCVISSVVLCSGARGLRWPGAGALSFGRKRCADALHITALRRMTDEQEQPGIAGHERLIEAKTQAGATGKLRVDDPD
jgi:hypothetical protein